MNLDPKLEVTVRYDILCHREHGVDLNFTKRELKNVR